MNRIHHFSLFSGCTIGVLPCWVTFDRSFCLSNFVWSVMVCQVTLFCVVLPGYIDLYSFQIIPITIDVLPCWVIFDWFDWFVCPVYIHWSVLYFQVTLICTVLPAYIALYYVARFHWSVPCCQVTLICTVLPGYIDLYCIARLHWSVLCCQVTLICTVLPGYIDLSKRRVSPEEVLKCEEKFAKAKAVSSC